MKKRNLFANLYFFGDREESNVRGKLASLFGCTFDDAYAKTDEDGSTTWFDQAFGFQLLFQMESLRDDGAWYLVTLSPVLDVFDSDSEMEEINFHVAQMLRGAGFDPVATLEEYRSQHYRPAPAQADA